MYHGGREAAQSINEAFKKEGVSDIINWVRELPLVYEDNHFVFAHAGINIPYGMVEQDREILWFEKNDFYEIKKESLLFYTNDKTVVHGHTPGSYVAFDGVRICIDLGAQVLDNGKLSLVELNEMIYFEYCFEDEQIQKQYIKKAE
jgi:serine/threonine protein phosphatase 1